MNDIYQKFSKSISNFWACSDGLKCKRKTNVQFKFKCNSNLKWSGIKLKSASIRTENLWRLKSNMQIFTQLFLDSVLRNELILHGHHLQPRRLYANPAVIDWRSFPMQVPLASHPFRFPIRLSQVSEMINLCWKELLQQSQYDRLLECFAVRFDRRECFGTSSASSHVRALLR